MFHFRLPRLYVISIGTWRRWDRPTARTDSEPKALIEEGRSWPYANRSDGQCG